jgi:phage replication-related protein YjqB (UPF0714/DUF867 family)
MSDTYANYADLSASETEGVDYQIVATPRTSNIAIVAIHGGGIETGTSELTVDTAGESYSSYLFEGLKSSGNGDLHITSTHFDEPNAIQIVTASEYCVTYHGYADSTNKHTKIGGADHDMKQQVYTKLLEAGFSAEILPEDDPIAGADPDNIVNKTTRGMGLQLEISTAQRGAFFGTNTRAGRKNTQTDEFYRYTQVVKDIIALVAK